MPNDSLFPNIWSKYDIVTRISRTSFYSNEIGVYATYLTFEQLHWLTIEKLIFNEVFVSYFYWNREIKYLWNVLQHQIAKLNTREMFFFFFSDGEIK